MINKIKSINLKYRLTIQINKFNKHKTYMYYKIKINKN